MRNRVLIVIVLAAALQAPLSPSQASEPPASSADRKASQAQAAGPTCRGHVATIVGTRGRDVLEGTRGHDVIVGLAGKDRIDGNGGDDVICGGHRGDVIFGGSGDDRIYGGGNWGAEDLHGGDGNDLLKAGGLGADFQGDGGNDRMVLTARHPKSARFWGDAGDDTMVTLHSTEQLIQFYYGDAPQGLTVDLSQGTATGWGQDTLQLAGARTVVFDGSAYDDTLIGTSGPDLLDGGAGDDTVQGLGGDDSIHIVSGVVDAGDGNDHVAIDASEVSQDANPAVVHAGNGNDYIYDDYDGPTDQLYGEAGNDYITAGAVSPGSDQVIDGGTGHNRLDLRLAAKPGGGDWQSAELDLAAGTLVADGVTSLISGFVDAGVPTPFKVHVVDLIIRGTDGPNTLSGPGIGVYGTGSTHFTLDGRGGNDTIKGSDGDDTINGGPGDDNANGADGIDTCTSVEGPTNCEIVNP